MRGVNTLGHAVIGITPPAIDSCPITAPSNSLFYAAGEKNEHPFAIPVTAAHSGDTQGAF